MTRVVFTDQRDDGGKAIFADQLPPDAQHFSASLISTSTTSARFVFTSKYIRVNLLGSASVNARMQKHSFISTSLKSTSSITATPKKYSLIRTTLTSESFAFGQIVAIVIPPAEFTATLGSTASVGARLSFLQTTNIEAELYSESSLRTRLVTTTSNIPRSAKLRAVPIESESGQLTRWRGDTYADVFLVFDDKTGLPVDVTGCSFRLALSEDKHPAKRDDLVYLLYGVSDPEAGLVYFAPTEDQADRVGFYYYDMEINDGKGLIKTLISSTYVYQQDITK